MRSCRPRSGCSTADSAPPSEIIASAATATTVDADGYLWPLEQRRQQLHLMAGIHFDIEVVSEVPLFSSRHHNDIVIEHTRHELFEGGSTQANPQLRLFRIPGWRRRSLLRRTKAPASRAAE